MRRRRFLVLLPAVLSAGCADLYDEITLNPDGSGTFRLLILSPEPAAGEPLEALRPRFEARARAIAERTGFRFRSLDVRREGRLLQVEALADFPTLRVFASPELLPGFSGSELVWSFVIPRRITFVGGRFRAEILRGALIPFDHPARASLPRHRARFVVRLPGDVTESNGDHVGDSVTWERSLSELWERPGEMTAVARKSSLWGTLVYGGVLLVGIVIVAASFLKKRG